MTTNRHPAPRLFGSFAGRTDGNGAALAAMAAGCDYQQISAGSMQLGTIGGSCAGRGDRIVAVIGSPRLSGCQRLVEAADLLDAFEKRGIEVLTVMEGDFAVAMADAASGDGWVATDRFGRFPLVAGTEGGQSVFASDATMLARHPDMSVALDPRALFDYVFFHVIPAPRSIFAGVTRLPAAHRLHWRNETQRIDAYWTPEFREDGTDPPRAVLERVETAVVREADELFAGAFLSGGLDSSTVAGCLALARKEPVPTFSIGFNAEGYDEIPYARRAAARFGTEPNEYYLQPDDLPDAIHRISTAFDEPFGNSSALPAFFCARMAHERGVKVLLAGDGGDELFAGNARYAAQRIFSHYTRLPGTLRRLVLDPILSHMPDSTPLLGKLRRYVAKANTPLPDRLQAYNFLALHEAAEIFSPELLDTLDAGEPFRLMREIYARPRQATELKRMLYLDWQQTLADNDLRKVRTSCELAGMPVRFPMLDDELAALAIRTPSDRLLKGRHLRHFYKQAVTGFLPDEIIEKKKHGFGLPFGVWMREHPRLRELAGDSLTDLAKRPYFRGDFVERVLEMHESGHAAYYGELAWILMVLEIWLRDRGID